MKADQIVVGRTYLAKVSNNVVPVRVDEIVTIGGFNTAGNQFNPTGHRVRGRTRYKCKNLKTGREVYVKSPQRFRCECDETGSMLPSKTAADQIADGTADPTLQAEYAEELEADKTEWS